MLMDYAFSDPNAENYKNMPRKREFKVTEKHSLFAHCKDPYGFWYVETNFGKVPGVFEGAAYTNYADIKRDIEGYIANFMTKKA